MKGGLGLGSAKTCHRRVPILRSNCVAGTVLVKNGHDMEMAAIKQGCLRIAR
jgi:hypothetical protein